MAALNYVHLVLDNPGVWVKIDDHGPTQQCDRDLFLLVHDLLRVLRVPCELRKQTNEIMAIGPPQPYRYPNAKDCMLEDSFKATSWDNRIKNRNQF